MADTDAASGEDRSRIESPDGGAPFVIGSRLTIYEAACVYRDAHPYPEVLGDLEGIDDWERAERFQGLFRDRATRPSGTPLTPAQEAARGAYIDLIRAVEQGEIPDAIRAYVSETKINPFKTTVPVGAVLDVARRRGDAGDTLAKLLAPVLTPRPRKKPGPQSSESEILAVLRDLDPDGDKFPSGKAAWRDCCDRKLGNTKDRSPPWSYGPEALTRLHQVLTLKRLGLSLAKIAVLISGRLSKLDAVLELQEEVLARRRDEATRGLDLVRSARARIACGEALSLDDLTTLTRETTMKDQAPDWAKKMQPLIDKHMSAEDKAAMAAKAGAFDQESVSAEWDELIAKAKSLLGTDPGAPEAQELARRWKTQVLRATGGDPAITTKMRQVW